MPKVWRHQRKKITKIYFKVTFALALKGYLAIYQMGRLKEMHQTTYSTEKKKKSGNSDRQVETGAPAPLRVRGGTPLIGGGLHTMEFHVSLGFARSLSINKE